MRPPLILLFNRSYDRFPETGEVACRIPCEFTRDRSRMAEADALIIHLPGCDRLWEARKYPGQLWVAWCRESDVTIPALRRPGFMRHFDLTMTYRREADVWWPYIPSAETLLALPRTKTETAPAVLFQSQSYDRSGRNAYLAELARYLRIDSYGRFLNNRRLAGDDGSAEAKLAVLARYKFTLAFENSRSPDYVTEKFFQPLMAGSVPVYRGAPNVADFAPGDKCFINADDFSGPAALAAHLDALARDEQAYGEYHAWRAGGFRPGFSAMLERIAENPFCRLAEAIGERRGERADLAGGTRFSRPFWQRGLVPESLLKNLALRRWWERLEAGRRKP
jgi:glycosyl transferase family 10 (putative fucosyltransferase)